MNRWIGRWLVGVGCLHTVFGIVFLRTFLAPIAGEGFFNTVNGQPEREFAVWFLVSGLMLVAFGAVIDWNEVRKHGWSRPLGWGFLGLTLVLLVIMPISGAWLLLPGSVGLILRGRATRAVERLDP